MKMNWFSRTSPPGTPPAPSGSDTTPSKHSSESGGPPSGPKKSSTLVPRKLIDKLNKMRNTVSFTGLAGTYAQQFAHATPPAVRGLEPTPREIPKPDLAAGAKQLAQMQKKIDESIDLVLQEHGISPDPAAASWVLPARASDKAAVEAINAQFSGAALAHGTTAGTIGKSLIDDFKAVFPDEAKARDAALLTAMAIRSVTHRPAGAQHAWDRIKDDASPQEMTPRQGRTMNGVLRALASTPVSFEALWAVKSAHGHAAAIAGHEEAYMTALRASAQLMKPENPKTGGLDLGADSHASIDDFAEHFEKRFGKKEPPKLGSTEGPDVLAAQALLYAQATMRGDKPTAAQTAAFMAWRNGYRESGPGTAFNEVVHRLHKFTTYALRATTDPKLFSSEAPAAIVQGAKAAFGKHLSPMSAMEIGTIGHHHPILDKVKDKFEKALRSSIDIAQEALEAEADQLADGGNPVRLQEVEAQIAILGHWVRNVGMRKNIRLDKDDARDQVLAIAREKGLGIYTEDGATLDKAAAMKERLNRTTLRKWATAALNAVASPEREGKLADLGEHLRIAKETSKALPDKVPAKPTLKQLCDLAIKSLPAIGLAYRDMGIHGIDLSPSIGFHTPKVSLSLSVGPQVRALHGRMAAVRIGSNSAGTELFVGTEHRVSGQAGIANRIAGRLAAFSAQLSVPVGGAGGEMARGTAAVVRAPKGVPGQKDLMEDVVKFLFEQANERATKKNSVDPALLWERFSTKFVSRPELTVNRQETFTNLARGGVSTNAGVRAGVGDASVGPVFGLGYDKTGFTDGWHETNGRQTGTLKNVANRNRGVASAALQGRPPAFAKFNQGMVSEVRMPTANVASAAMDLDVGGKEGQTRLVIMDGTVSHEHTLFYSKYRSEADHLNALAANTVDWKRSLRDGGRDEGEVEAYMKDVVNLPAEGPAGNRYYMDRSKLKPEAASELTTLLSFRQMSARRNRPQAEMGALDAQIEQVMKSPDSREPEKLTVYEVDATTIDKGLDFFISTRNRRQVFSTLRNLNHELSPNAPVAGASLPKEQQVVAGPSTTGKPSLDMTSDEEVFLPDGDKRKGKDRADGKLPGGGVPQTPAEGSTKAQGPLSESASAPAPDLLLDQALQDWLLMEKAMEEAMNRLNPES